MVFFKILKNFVCRMTVTGSKASPKAKEFVKSVNAVQDVHFSLYGVIKGLHTLFFMFFVAMDRFY